MSMCKTLYDYIIGISIGIGNIGVAFPEVLLVLKGIGISTEFGIAIGICIGIGHSPSLGSSWCFFITCIGRCVGIGFGSPWCCLPLDFA